MIDMMVHGKARKNGTAAYPKNRTLRISIDGYYLALTNTYHSGLLASQCMSSVGCTASYFTISATCIAVAMAGKMMIGILNTGRHSRVLVWRSLS